MTKHMTLEEFDDAATADLEETNPNWDRRSRIDTCRWALRQKDISEETLRKVYGDEIVELIIRQNKRRLTLPAKMRRAYQAVKAGTNFLEHNQNDIEMICGKPIHITDANNGPAQNLFHSVVNGMKSYDSRIFNAVMLKLTDRVTRMGYTVRSDVLGNGPYRKVAFSRHRFNPVKPNF